MDKNIKGILEGLLYLAGDKGLTIAEIILILETNETVIKDTIDELNEFYNENNSGFEIIKTSETYKLVTRKEYTAYYQKLADLDFNDSISRQTMETLAIIAYKQPITRYEIDEVRGVDSMYAVRTLINRDLIKVVGKSEEIGKPLLYGTTDEFLDYLGLNSLAELPAEEQFLPTDEEIRESLFKDDFDQEFAKIGERLKINKNALNEMVEQEIAQLDEVEIKNVVTFEAQKLAENAENSFEKESAEQNDDTN